MAATDETTTIEEVTEPVERAEDILPVEVPPDPVSEVARLREENARLIGENRVLREPPREAAPSREESAPPVDPLTAEYRKIEDQFAKGDINDAERTMRLGALGAEAAIARREQAQQVADAKTRADQARQRNGQKVAVYITRWPGLQNATGPEMQRVKPHLRAVCEEFDWPAEDERAQVLALERTFGPIDRSLTMAEHREFERQRHPIGGGGSGGGEEPPPSGRPESKGERLFKRLLPEHRDFFLAARGSREAAVKTLEYADEALMRKQGRFIS